MKELDRARNEAGERTSRARDVVKSRRDKCGIARLDRRPRPLACRNAVRCVSAIARDAGCSLSGARVRAPVVFP